ncbi:sensor histidine kinase [Sciscionella sediminilitoris]|uniref:sensor histidine kinase n=1 Tax=Sciscionella sediminilitoris TaxID=1445613 RepID=UPI0004DF7F36|nr:HAMP domain-containing sensor histidine kinase [Sciscionella sp. SE31]
MRLRHNRHGLLTRLLVMAVVVAVASIGATAWLAAQSTSGAINRELGETLAHDAKIYDSLLGYAATHPRWSGVQRRVDQLAGQTGRRITLTTTTRAPIADSGAKKDVALPRTPSAVVDPLAVDAVLKPEASASGIDARAVGPYRLTKAEHDRLHGAARRQQQCLRRYGEDGTIVEQPNGRSVVEHVTPAPVSTPAPAQRPKSAATETPVPKVPSARSEICGGQQPATQTERKASEALLQLADSCLQRQGKGPLPVEPSGLTSPEELTTGPATKSCVDAARREQLGPYVSPAAQLFITRPDGNVATASLSTVGVARIVWTALAVLVVTIGVAAFAASRLVRPIHAITAAARKMGDGDRSARVETATRGEIGELAAAFNTMSAQIAMAEGQRKTMVSDIAHELRTPLVNLRGWLEAVEDGVAELDPPLVTSLLEETVLLQHLIDDLQDLALADAGRLRVHPEPVDVKSIVDQVVAVHRGAAEAEGVELAMRVDGEPDLSADPTRLRQALGNLVSNAVRHTPSGGQVTLWAREHGEEVLIDVADTGTGIDEEALPHIFDRFWRAEKSRNRGGGGSGLGLAITHHLVQAHGGGLAVRSEVGTGTTFTMRLAADPAADDR